MRKGWKKSVRKSECVAIDCSYKDCTHLALSIGRERRGEASRGRVVHKRSHIRCDFIFICTLHFLRSNRECDLHTIAVCVCRGLQQATSSSSLLVARLNGYDYDDNVSFTSHIRHTRVLCGTREECEDTPRDRLHECNANRVALIAELIHRDAANKDRRLDHGGSRSGCQSGRIRFLAGGDTWLRCCQGKGRDRRWG